MPEARLESRRENALNANRSIHAGKEKWNRSVVKNTPQMFSQMFSKLQLTNFMTVHDGPQKENYGFQEGLQKGRVFLTTHFREGFSPDQRPHQLLIDQYRSVIPYDGWLWVQLVAGENHI